jgi:hypothetical protein
MDACLLAESPERTGKADPGAPRAGSHRLLAGRAERRHAPSVTAGQGGSEAGLTRVGTETCAKDPCCSVSVSDIGCLFACLLARKLRVFRPARRAEASLRGACHDVLNTVLRLTCSRASAVAGRGHIRFDSGPRTFRAQPMLRRPPAETLVTRRPGDALSGGPE